ncbi:MAG TPA: hypothetical protein P5081_06740 [Phycisphaerae bacterium]|nr:hypothetical protein [Phycisphaerae bacterium]HRW52568.1 hypothetical protein [Phycisphaerae bacterium]
MTVQSLQTATQSTRAATVRTISELQGYGAQLALFASTLDSGFLDSANSAEDAPARTGDDGETMQPTNGTHHSGSRGANKRNAQVKLCVRDHERFVFDEIACAISSACGTKVTFNNITRAALILVHECRDEIIARCKASGMQRPHNHDAEKLDAFELEIAKVIAKAAARSSLAE